MKLQLVVETPDDEEIHWQRIGKALIEYTQKVAIHNEYPDGPGDRRLGCTEGPNSMTASNGVIITERKL